MYDEELRKHCADLDIKIAYLNDAINEGYASRSGLLDVQNCMKTSLKFLNQFQTMEEVVPAGYSRTLDVADIYIKDIAKIEIPGHPYIDKAFDGNPIYYGKSSEFRDYFNELMRYRRDRICNYLGPITSRFRPQCAKKIKEGTVKISEVHTKNLMYTPYDYFTEYSDILNVYSFDNLVIECLSNRASQPSGYCLGDYLPSIEEMMNAARVLDIGYVLKWTGAFKRPVLTYREYLKQLMTFVIILHGPKGENGPFMQFIDDLESLKRHHSNTKTVLGGCIKRMCDMTGNYKIAQGIYNELLTTAKAINRSANEMYQDIQYGNIDTFVISLYPVTTREYDVYIGYLNNVYKFSALPVGMPFVLYDGNYRIDDTRGPAFVNPEHIYKRTDNDTVKGYFRYECLLSALNDDFATPSFKENMKDEISDPSLLLRNYIRPRSKKHEACVLLRDNVNVLPLFKIGTFKIKL